MRVYLDNCCFNRPYDEQSLLKVRFETQSKLNIQKLIIDGKLLKCGLRQKDSFHVACAIFSNADYFITTDKGILNKGISEIKVINPLDFIFLVEGSI